MNTMQEMLLSMLRNPLFKYFLFSPTLRYLIKQLQIDMISPVVRGYTGRDMLLEVERKLSEEWKLAFFAETNFYRRMVRDGLITESQFRRLERELDRFRHELLVVPAAEQTPAIYQTADGFDQVISSARDIPISNDIRLSVSIMYKKPTPLPWELDPDFFEKHPPENQTLHDLHHRELKIAWYHRLWGTLAAEMR